MSKWKLSFPDQSSIAKWLIKEKKDIFETLSVPLLDDISHRLLICKAEKSKFCVKIWNISHYQQAFGMMQWFIFRYLAWSFCFWKMKQQYHLIWL
jgi:hypothetical protein